MDDAEGGYYDSGRFARPMRPGAATLWITTDGTLDVGQWGRDVSTMTPGLVMARQNLDLIVDGGQPVPGVQDNDPARWGQDRRQLGPGVAVGARGHRQRGAWCTWPGRG